MGIKLFDYQLDAVERMHNGYILCGDVGSGKSRTGIAYYFKENGGGLDPDEGNVFKYVFTGKDFVAEAVLYRYGNFYKRTVICCSTMSGCPVGCKFCGTGNKFVRNLTPEEIIYQIDYILSDMNIKDISSKGERFQIMFMSMGEPFLNYKSMRDANIIVIRFAILISEIQLFTNQISWLLR